MVVPAWHFSELFAVGNLLGRAMLRGEGAEFRGSRGIRCHCG